jgi:hypothetical protein
LSLTNYSELRSTIASYLGRTDLNSQIPAFISLAELRLARQLRIRQMLKTVTTATVPGDKTLGLPSDFIGIRDIYLDTTPKTPLSFLSPSALTRDTMSHEVRTPKFYTQAGSEFILSPVPDSAYTVVMLYYARPLSLSDSNPSNVFMAVCPDALLYASLLEAEPYLMNDARTQVWSTLYANAVENLSQSDNAAEYAGVPISMTVR